MTDTVAAGRPARVLHVYSGNLYGGVETFLATLARGCDLAPGLEQEFALCFKGRLADELRATGAEVHRLGAVRFSRPWTAWTARRRLSRLIRQRGVDVVVTHACWPHALAAPVARRAGRPLVFWMHDMVGPSLHWLERRAARIPPDLVLVHSNCTAETLPRLFPGVAWEVLRYPVAARLLDRAEARRAVRAELGASDAEVVVVTTCRLEPWKGHALLIDALARLGDRPGWTAWIAGGAQRPHERAYLEGLHARARELGIEGRLRFLGERRDVPRLLAAADIHCQPNIGAEPFGIAFVEALYAGLPVVSTRLGGAAEIVTEACGVLVAPADPAALAVALRSLIDDPEARARLGAAGPARAASLCDPALVLGRLAVVLTGLAAGAGPFTVSESRSD